MQKSPDRGESWLAINAGLTEKDVRTVAVSPNYISDHTVFCGTANSKVFKSTNYGGNWSNSSADLPGGTNTVSSLAVSPAFASDQTIFAGIYGSGVFSSTNSGGNWKTANNGLTDLDVNDLAISPNFATDKTIFAATDGGVFKSINKGASWTLVNEELTYRDMYALDISPNFASDGILVSSFSQVYISYDRGENWSVLGTPEWVRYAPSVEILSVSSEPLVLTVTDGQSAWLYTKFSQLFLPIIQR